MQLDLPPDVVRLIDKRLATGCYANAEDVVRRALELQDEEENAMMADISSEEDRLALSALLEERYLEAERGVFLTPEQAERELEAAKAEWRAKRVARK